MALAANPNGGLLFVSCLALVLFGGVLLLFAVPFVRALLEVRRTGSWWSPFERRPDGRWGGLANTRSLASFRAPDPAGRTPAGLRLRWAAWTVVVLGLCVYPAVLVGDIIRSL